MSGGAALRVRAPSDPLELRLASINRVLVGEVCSALPPTRFRALLWYDSSLPYEAIGCDKHSFPAAKQRGPSRVMSQVQSNFSKPFLRFCLVLEPSWKGPRDEGVGREAKREPEAGVAQKTRTRRRAEGGRGSVTHTPTPRTRECALPARMVFKARPAQDKGCGDQPRCRWHVGFAKQYFVSHQGENGEHRTRSAVFPTRLFFLKILKCLPGTIWAD